MVHHKIVCIHEIDDPFFSVTIHLRAAGCHCEEPGDEAISRYGKSNQRDCFALLAMTNRRFSSSPARVNAYSLVFGVGRIPPGIPLAIDPTPVHDKPDNENDAVNSAVCMAEGMTMSGKEFYGSLLRGAGIFPISGLFLTVTIPGWLWKSEASYKKEFLADGDHLLFLERELFLAQLTDLYADTMLFADIASLHIPAGNSSDHQIGQPWTCIEHIPAKYRSSFWTWSCRRWAAHSVWKSCRRLIPQPGSLLPAVKQTEVEALWQYAIRQKVS